MRLGRRTVFLGLLATLFFSAVFLMLTQRVFAITTSDTLSYTQDVAIYGPHSGNAAPYSHYTVITHGSGAITVTLETCVGNGGTAGLLAFVDGSTGKYSGPGGGATECPNTSLSFNVGVGTHILTVQKTYGEGHQPFKVSATNNSSSPPTVSYLPDDNRAASGTTPGERDLYAFNVWMGSTRQFDFTVPCNADGNNSAADGVDNYVKWFDADQYTLNADLYSYLEYYDKDTGSWVGSPHFNMGGNVSTGQLKFTALPGVHYRFLVKNGVGANVMSFLLPYAYNPDQGECDQKPQGSLYSVQCNYIKGWALDNNDSTQPINYDLYLDGNYITYGTANQSNLSGINAQYNSHEFQNNYNLNPYFQGNQTHTITLKARNLLPDGSTGSVQVVDTKTVTRDCSGASNGQGRCTYSKISDSGTFVDSSGVSHHSRTFIFISKPGTTTPGVVLSSASPGIPNVPGPGLPATFGETDSGGHFVNMAGWSNDGNITPSRVYNYVPGSADITVNIQHQVEVSPGNWQSASSVGGNPDVNTTITCYHAYCTKIVQPGNGPGGVHLAGEPVTVHYTLWNDSPYPDYLDLPNKYLFTASLGLRGTQSQALGDNLENGSSLPIDISYPTSGGAQILNFSAVPTFMGAFDIGSDCGGSVDVYQEFHITLGAAANFSNNDNEDPNGINLSTSVCNDAGVTVRVPTTSTGTFTPAGGTPSTIGGNTGGDYAPNCSTAWSLSQGVSGVNAGDSYCAKIDATAYTHGWIGGGGPLDVINYDTPGSSYPPPHCATVNNEPYVHFVGSGVSAGGDFEGNNTCTSTAGAIHTYSKASGQVASVPRGSGSQFGASALGIIEGLSSANLRTGSPTANIGLSFANTVVNSGSGSPAGAFGGNLGVYGSCLKDYFGAKPDSTSQQIATATTAGVSSGAQYYKPPSMFTLTAGSLANGVNQTIYVEGKDVYINQSSGSTKINYAGANGWTSLTDIPSFMLVVKGGNIYIDKSITQLDGIYVAQASGGMGGTINTCATGTGGLLGAQIYGSAGCNKQLVVNGAFVANKIFLNRSYSSLRYSTAGENPFYNPLIHPCGNAGEDVPVGATSATDCAAEIFNFSPEMYLAQPDIDASHGPTKPVFDYVTSLSPVL